MHEKYLNIITRYIQRICLMYFHYINMNQKSLVVRKYKVFIMIFKAGKLISNTHHFSRIRYRDK